MVPLSRGIIVFHGIVLAVLFCQRNNVEPFLQRFRVLLSKPTYLCKSLLISNLNSVQPMKIQLPMHFSEVSGSSGLFKFSQGAKV